MVTVGPKTTSAEGKPTIQESSRKINAHISIPSWIRACVHRSRDPLCLNLLHLCKYAVPSPEAYDDLGHAQEKGLDPELHELAVKDVHVVRAADVGGGFEFDPVRWGTGDSGFGVPD